ncbi:putative transcriptional regulatory protein R02753 [Siccirubricoccus deserti]|uniref:Probable transcriptional regulatory protein H7965_07505 n=1 Tax=Siccirubricoccus deserti TaxID=2013562 RepID=A0A9X0QWH0_9PROT|nr:YebC/PmpR family DNA-binding transcriptional regulator [Siccirubricoccus deserti]MBC4015170.1 YebC/PmpR family DNA-binding transcriptional regulator [Siccirubricoccus deserti]GGC38423.1 putative transcriptional regulatory protein R02753 [Siccirubricoccus deserti]
MAGHSHAKNIMHRKAAQGAKKAQAFGKLIREITVSAKLGLPDPAMNPRLRAAVKAALIANMTRDTIDRAIKRASTAGQGEDYQEVRYEGYGPNGVAIIVEALTDNRNRTAGDIRSAFAKHGGALGETNSVSFQFERRGVLWFPGLPGKEEEILEAAIEAGAQDVESDEEGHEVTCAPEDFFAVRDAMEAKFGSPESAKIEWVPNVLVELDEEKAREVLKLLDRLDESDDVQNVYANFEVSDAVSQKLSA